jgi:hypothetical protein
VGELSGMKTLICFCVFAYTERQRNLLLLLILLESWDNLQVMSCARDLYSTCIVIYAYFFVV